MTRLSLYVFAAALTLSISATVLTGVGAGGPQSAASQINRTTNAAFRDGLYVGKLDALQGNRPHLSSGRWSADLDRRSYVAGYQKGYNQVLQAGAKTTGPEMAEVNGYRDGLLDGSNDRRAAKPFQLSKTDNYRSASRGLAEATDQEGNRQAYRQAYANGYQEAYYGHDRVQPDNSELSRSM